MSAPRRIQLKRVKGWRMPRNTVKVDRTTKFGNHFRITNALLIVCNGDRLKAQEAAVTSFRDWLDGSSAGRQMKRVIRAELCGKNLGCWCREGTCCHGDILLKIANA